MKLQEGEKPVYTERVNAPVWVYFLLSTPLGVVLAAMTGLLVTGAVEGSEAVIVYLAFGFVAVLLVILLVNFTTLLVTVGDDGLTFAFGVFRKRLPWSQVRSAEARDYRWLAYGGWGVRWALAGRWAWSVPGVKRGVLIDAGNAQRKKTYFLSSARPDELARAVNTRAQRASPEQA